VPRTVVRPAEAALPAAAAQAARHGQAARPVQPVPHEQAVPSRQTARLEEQVDALLPQTQCGKCGFDGCRPYARAIAADTAPINRCPPGGRAGISRLARLLGRPELPLDPACGVEGP